MFVIPYKDIGASCYPLKKDVTYRSFSEASDSVALFWARQMVMSTDADARLESVVLLLPPATLQMCQLASSTETNCFKRSRYWLYSSTSLCPAPYEKKINLNTP